VAPHERGDAACGQGGEQRLGPDMLVKVRAHGQKITKSTHFVKIAVKQFTLARGGPVARLVYRGADDR
jgi:hypothetical protein